jgi:hypothetical protein
MRERGQNMSSGANVADTAVACLVLLRSGNTPTSGAYSGQLVKGIEFICAHVEKSDDKSLSVTDVKGTRLQAKLGTFIDTFAAALLLAEVKDLMADQAGNKRVLTALDKVMDKIEKNQQANGAFAQDGWAPALAQGLASKAVNRAISNGAVVNEQVKARLDNYAQGNVSQGGRGIVIAGAAGVELYARSSNAAALNDADQANRQVEAQLQAIVASPATQPAAVVEEARQQLGEIMTNRAQLQQANAGVIERLNNQQFIAGFGSNGGEEFLSYMNLGETLLAQGGENWTKWDAKMTESLNRIQNDDGSWSGHHCITGKTFCTSAALLVLMVDRAPQGTVDRLRGK